MSRRITPAVLALGTVGALAILLVLQRTGAAAWQPGGDFRVSDVSVLRVSDVRVEALPVYRVVTDGEAVTLGPGGAPTIRVDFDVGGRHVTVWIKDP